MGQFSGSIICTKPANHVFVFHHAILEDYGLCNVNIPSLKALDISDQQEYKNRLRITEGNVDWNQDPNPFPWFTSAWKASQWYYFRAGADGYTRTNISGDYIYELLLFHDKSDEEQEKDLNKKSKRKAISYIQHSRDGYIRCVDATESRPYETDFMTGMGYDFLYHIRIYFLNRSLQNNSRPLASKVDNMFTGVPRRNSGATFSAGRSRDAETGVYDGNGISGTADGNDQVAGPLLTVWNENLGGFQSPGPFLARLLTDVDSANIPMIALDISSTVNRDPADFQSGGANNSSNAVYGYATPFSVHNGNPESFGPNLEKCDDRTNVEKIQVVNRSNTRFSSGEVVLVYPIDGEFIIGKYSPLTAEAIPLSIGRVGFYQFIATSDELFRGKFTPTDEEQENSNATEYMLPDDVLKTARFKIYGDGADNSNPQRRNGVKSLPEWMKTVKLNPYYQVFPRDIPHPGLINTFNNPNPEDVGIGGLSESIPLWWGPVFTEGVSAGNSFGIGYSGIWVNSRTFEVTDISAVFESAENFDKFNIHAATATNGPFGQGFPQQSCYTPIVQWNRIGNQFTGFSHTNPSYHVVPSGIGEESNKVNKTQPYYNLSAANKGNVVFQLCPAEYVGIIDNGSEFGVLPDGAPGLIPGTDRICRKLWSSGATAFLNKKPDANIEAVRNQIRGVCNRRELVFKDGYSNINFAERVQRDIAGNTTGNHYFYNKAQSLSFVCFAYDAYSLYMALNRPKDTNALWGGDGALNSTVDNQKYITSRIGANTVGITVMRQKFAQGGVTGSTLSLDTEGLFGVRGRSYGLGASTTFTTSFLGSLFMAAIGNSSVDTRGLTSAFGSTTGDSYFGFGSAGIFVRIYDAWPDQDTLAIPQYYTFLHFNPSTFYGVDENGVLKTSFNNELLLNDVDYQDTGSLRNDVRQTLKEVRFYTVETDEDGNEDVTWEDKKILIDVADPAMPDWLKERADTNYLNYYIPTQAGYVEATDPDDSKKKIRYRATGGTEGQELPIGPVKSEAYLRPMDEWKLDTDRRGRFVSDVGYLYSQKVIGVGTGNILDGGENFVKDDVISARNGIEIKVTAVDSDGAITEFEFNKQQITAPNGDKIDIPQRGTGIQPGDLPVTISITSKGGGDFAEISFPEGYCYYRYGIDYGPKSLAGPVRVTLGSGEGKTWVEGSRGTTIEASPTVATRYAGQYEAVYFVQNDITMATVREQNSTSGSPRLQFFRLNVS